MQLWGLVRKHDGPILCADPIACLPLILAGKCFTFLSLEMYEYQLPNDSIRRMLRNLLFWGAHRMSLRTADTVVFCNEERQRFYLERVPGLQDKTCVMENFHARQDMVFAPLPDVIADIFEDKLRSYESVFIYAGGLQVGRFIPELISAFRKLSGKLLILAGRDNSGIIPSDLPDNILFVGNLDKSALNTLLRSCDYGLMFYSNDLLNTRYCAPVKLHEYGALGLNILSNENVAISKRHELIFKIWDDRQDLAEFIATLPPKPPKPSYCHPSWEDELEANYRFIIKKVLR